MVGSCRLLLCAQWDTCGTRTWLIFGELSHRERMVGQVTTVESRFSGFSGNECATGFFPVTIQTFHAQLLGAMRLIYRHSRPKFVVCNSCRLLPIPWCLSTIVPVPSLLSCTSLIES